MRKMIEPEKTIQIVDLNKGDETEVKVYSKDYIMQIMGKISESVEEYKWKYRLEPNFIVISPELEIFMRDYLKTLNYGERVFVNRRPIEVHMVFGIPTITSPKKEKLDYEVI